MKQILRDKIKYEIRETFKDGCEFADGYDEKIKGTADDRVNSILSLIHQEIRECLKLKGKDFDYHGDDKSEVIFRDGYKIGVSDIKEKLKEKGLLDKV